MWRFGRFTDLEGNPLEFPIADENINSWEGQILFLAGCGEANCVNATDDNSNGVVDEWRKFFYPPSITLEDGYDLVFMGTGDREDPCNTISSDRIYAVKDANTSVTVDESDLIDVTDSTATLPDLNFDQGWFIRLVAGEKVLAEGIVFNKTFYISTYSAIGSGGSATLYALQYKTGGTVGGYLSRQVWEGGGFLSRPVIVINETGQKLFTSVGTDNSSGGPGPVSPGVLVIDPIAPPSNLFYLWWKEL
jgi:type IV pilus assembly protein PilY1